MMKFVTLSDLRLRTSEVIKEVEESEERFIVTKNGIPVALIKPVEEGGFEYKNHLNNHKKGGEKRHGKSKRRL